MLQRRALGNRTSWSWRPANTPSFLRVAQREVRTSLCKSYEHCRVSPLVVTHLCSHLHMAARCCSTVNQAASASPQIIELQRLLKSCGSHKSVSDNPIDQEEPWKSALRVAFNGAVPELPLPLPSQQHPEVMRWVLVVALKANAPDDVCSALYAAIRTTDSCASSIRAKPFESGIQHAMARHWLRRCYAVAPSLGGSGPDSHNGWPEAILFVLSALRMLLVDADASAPRKPSSVLLLMESLQLFTALPHFHLSPNSKDDARASDEDALLQWLRAPGRADLLLQRCLQELLSTASISWRLQQEAVLIFLSGSILTARCPAHMTMPPTLLARCVTIRGLTTTAREHGDDEDGGLGGGEGGVQRLQRQVHEWSLLTASATGDAAHSESWSVPLIQALISPLSGSQSREDAVQMCCGSALAWSVRSVLQLLAGIRDENHVLDRRQWDIASDVVVEWLHKVLLQLASIASVAGVREHQRLAVEEEVWRCVLESVQHGYFAPIGTSDARKRASRDVLREVVLPLFGQQYWRGAAVNVFVEVMGAWGKSKVLRDVFQTIRRQEATQGRQVLEALRGAKEGEGEDARVELPAYHPTLSLQSCALIFDHCVGEHLEDGENPHMGGEVVRYALVVLRLLESAEPSASLLDGRTLEQWLHWVHTEALPEVNAARERNGMDE